MIDLKELKERESEIRENIKNRFMDVDFDEILTLQQKRYELLQKTEELRARRNANAQKMKGKMDRRRGKSDQGGAPERRRGIQ